MICKKINSSGHFDDFTPMDSYGVKLRCRYYGYRIMKCNTVLHQNGRFLDHKIVKELCLALDESVLHAETLSLLIFKAPQTLDFYFAN